MKVDHASAKLKQLLFQRLTGLIRKAAGRQAAVFQAANYFLEKDVFAVEMVVNRTFGYRGSTGDLVHTGLFKSQLRKGLDCGVENGLVFFGRGLASFGGGNAGGGIIGPNRFSFFLGGGAQESATP